MPALIFDCDGVLADTERYGHLPAFNQTFAEFGVPVHWTDDEYAEVLKIGGGKERMALDADARVRRGQATCRPTPSEQTELLADLAPAQDRHLHAMVAAGAMPARPGIAGSPRRRRRRLAARRRVDVRRTIGAGRPRARRRRRAGRRTSPSSPATSCPQEARTGHLPARYQPSCSVDADDGVVVEDSATGCGRARRRPRPAS